VLLAGSESIWGWVCAGHRRAGVAGWFGASLRLSLCWSQKGRCCWLVRCQSGAEFVPVTEGPVLLAGSVSVWGWVSAGRRRVGAIGGTAWSHPWRLRPRLPRPGPGPPAPL